MLNRIIISIFCALQVFTGAYAKKKQEYPRAEIKVSYNYHNKFLRVEADEPSGQYSFVATGIESSSQPIFPLFSSKYERMNRLDMLRALRHYRENSNAMFKAATGYELGGGVDAPVTEESRKYDFLETDYHK